MRSLGKAHAGRPPPPPSMHVVVAGWSVSAAEGGALALLLQTHGRAQFYSQTPNMVKVLTERQTFLNTSAGLEAGDQALSDYVVYIVWFSSSQKVYGFMIVLLTGKAVSFHKVQVYSKGELFLEVFN